MSEFDTFFGCRSTAPNDLNFDPEPVRVIELRGQLADCGAVRLEDAVEATQDRERENHGPVLVGAVDG